MLCASLILYKTRNSSKRSKRIGNTFTTFVIEKVLYYGSVCVCVCFCVGMCANKQTFFRDIDEGVWQMMLGKIDYDDETNRVPTVFDYGCVRLSSSHCPSKEDKCYPSFWSMKICVGHKSTISQRHYLYVLVNHVLGMYIESLRWMGNI